MEPSRRRSRLPSSGSPVLGRRRAGGARGLALVAALWLLSSCGGRALPATGHAEPPPGGVAAFLSEEACPELAPYQALDAFGKWTFPEQTYEAVRTNSALECRRIEYASDGARVSGLLLRPRHPGTRTWPVILYARGGSGDFGAIDALTRVDLSVLAQAGYVVLATNYRFTGALARQDEWGGKDLDDLMNLVPVARSLPYVDAAQLFLLGQSRGGMMVYLALKRGIAVKAAAVVAGVADLMSMASERPEFVTGTEDFDGWAKVWPDFAQRKDELLRERSAIFWPEQLSTPLLILHSRDDSRVPVRQSLLLAERLLLNGKEFELVIYGHDGHSLPLSRASRNDHIVRWFRAHDGRPQPPASPPR
ncbi:MAG: prolyl oligopeptidase family serine peptidase [Myxococcales bacterium]|nr:prolyl oligopeptidase family serine peptidase [Myxococcales bacterium]